MYVLSPDGKDGNGLHPGKRNEAKFFQVYRFCPKKTR